MAIRRLEDIKQAASELSASERLELAKYLFARSSLEEYPAKVVDLSRFYGIVKFEKDAMELQRRWRAEWD